MPHVIQNGNAVVVGGKDRVMGMDRHALRNSPDFNTHILHQHRYGSFLAPLGEHVNNTVQIINMDEGR